MGEQLSSPFYEQWTFGFGIAINRTKMFAIEVKPLRQFGIHNMNLTWTKSGYTRNHEQCMAHSQHTKSGSIAHSSDNFVVGNLQGPQSSVHKTNQAFPYKY